MGCHNNFVWGATTILYGVPQQRGSCGTYHKSVYSIERSADVVKRAVATDYRLLQQTIGCCNRKYRLFEGVHTLVCEML